MVESKKLALEKLKMLRCYWARVEFISWTLAVRCLIVMCDGAEWFLKETSYIQDDCSFDGHSDDSRLEGLAERLL